MITDRPSNGTTDNRTGEKSMDKTMSNVANKAKDEAESTIGHLSQMARDKVSDAASYVRDRGVSGLRTDVVDLASKHPLSAIAVSVGLGYLIGRVMTRRS
jgi:ElaB/YqjD/DUF883 family membrane-anchored ribosome-binding protein